MSDAPKVKRASKPRQVFQHLDGTALNLKETSKFHRDVLVYHHGAEIHDQDAKTPALVTRFNAHDPLMDELLVPGRNSPVCQKCTLHDCGAEHPYLDPVGSTDP